MKIQKIKLLLEEYKLE